VGTRIRIASALAATALLAGCASFDGRGLEPGKATRADVEATMGRPAQVLTRPNGDTRLYFSRLPEGREIYLATIGSDGVLRGIERTLTRKNIAKLKEGLIAAEVRELLGPPYRSVYMKLSDRDVWEYPWRIVEDRRILWVQFSRDGIVQEIIEMHDYDSDPPSGPPAQRAH
jgi:outer membrane protein assembly factor BamE (lipoprotein component of BamABCDE complex)